MPCSAKEQKKKAEKEKKIAAEKAKKEKQIAAEKLAKEEKAAAEKKAKAAEKAKREAEKLRDTLKSLEQKKIKDEATEKSTVAEMKKLDSEIAAARKKLAELKK